jgi:hypothetical protein
MKRSVTEFRGSSIHTTSGARRKGIPMRRLGLAVAILAVPVLVTSGCGAGKAAVGSADDAARIWMTETDDILRSGKGSVVIGEVPNWRASLGRQLDDQLGGAPAVSELSPAVKAELESSIRQARNLRTFYTYVDDLSARAVAADDAVPAMVRGSALYELSPQAMQVLEDAGREIGKSTVCGLAWELMTPDEQAAAQQTGDGVDSTVANLIGLGADALVAAISGFLQSKAYGALIDPAVVDWTMYATGIYGKAAEITADGGEMIVVNDIDVTRAMVQYARFCLAPPG